MDHGEGWGRSIVTIAIGVVCEGPDDRRTGCALADHVICSRVSWIERKRCRLSALGEASSQIPVLDLEKGSQLATGAGIRVHGFFENEPTAPNATKALRLFHSAVDPPHAIVFLRDEDSDARQAVALRRARETSNHRTRLSSDSPSR